MSDTRDTLVNGLIAGLATPFLFYFVVQGIESLLANYVLEDWNGFSERLTYIFCIVANAFPFQIFTWQERGRSMQGVVTATIILTFILIFYFRETFF